MITARCRAIDPYRYLTILTILVAVTAWMLVGTARADIYSWTDANGVIHFTNYDPPPQADYYMQEHKTEEALESEPTDSAAERKDVLQKQLEEANSKLENALDKVADLTDKVEQTRIEARIAAQAARRAEAEAKIAGETRREKTVVFGYPYRRYKPDRPHPEPYYWKHDTSQYPYYDAGRKKNTTHHEMKPAGGAVTIKSRRAGTSVRITSVAGSAGLRR